MQDAIYNLLSREMSSDDPWRLDTNPFEQKRYDEMLRLSLSEGPIANALEVGCAAGAFTDKLAPHCERLTVIDILPQAIARARQRVNNRPHITWIVADILEFSTKERFDLIVVAEVLYYLGGIPEMRAAVGNLVRMLAPGGHLVFGSADDANCRRWGHVAGAETVTAILSEKLTEVDRLQCSGQSVNEECLLTRFRNSGLISG
ncbi:Ubiquinone biosynthesis O-methyltransferase [Ensifer psoraleae]|uniref:nodulation methyltransferase NodS n=1 Tax=Sinorhizobium psoraleae TaxID=520838 RepID=UPI00156A4B58|nr:nodulation methyltransferase NodS [Sinorhizobium psoraleae]NRP76058.1 Ubiquinone biosynthesis O-methyltransferase [Sinorhizobium psoraleae]